MSYDKTVALLTEIIQELTGKTNAKGFKKARRIAASALIEIIGVEAYDKLDLPSRDVMGVCRDD